MKIAIDCRSLRKKPAGVPNFLIAMINNLATQRKHWVLYLISNEAFSAEVNNKLLSSENIIPIIKPLTLFPKSATVWYFLKTYFIIRNLKVDLFYTPIPNLPIFIPSNVKTMITVHDMVYRLFPNTMSIGNRLINFFLHDRSIRRADKIWAISNYTVGEVENFYPERKCSRIVVGTAVDKNIYRVRAYSSKEKAELFDKFNITCPFLLTVGTIEPRKNLQFLFSLMPALAAKEFQLVIVGARGWGNVYSNEMDMRNYPVDKAKFVGFVSDEDLVKLYHFALVYLSVSLNEGFCLPLLEAMSCGCPVIAAHNSGMIEVVEGGGETVRSWDKNDWVTTIEKVIAHRQEYAERGLDKSGKYEWVSVINRIANYIEEH
jgi:glycosyltransferase involved in cell wall biosynthesis